MAEEISRGRHATAAAVEAAASAAVAGVAAGEQIENGFSRCGDVAVV